jgi:hypothetical protein
VRSSLCALLVAQLACGEALHFAYDEGPPLARLRATIDGGAPESLSGSLRAGLVWAALDDVVCASADRVTTCDRRPEDFAARGGSDVVEIEPVFPSSFVVPLMALPAPALLSGGEGDWFGYAELVIFDDGNHNGVLDVVATGAESSADTIVASGGRAAAAEASFVHYVVYREGALVPAWQLFSARGCVEPPLGYSVVRLGTGDDGGCWVGDRAVLMRFADIDAVRALICAPPPVRSTFPAQEPPAGSDVSCMSPTSLELVIDPSRYCPDVRRFDLVGCADPLGCDQPEWDLTATPPEWWPC